MFGFRKFRPESFLFDNLVREVEEGMNSKLVKAAIVLMEENKKLRAEIEELKGKKPEDEVITFPDDLKPEPGKSLDARMVDVEKAIADLKDAFPFAFKS